MDNMSPAKKLALETVIHSRADY